MYFFKVSESKKNMILTLHFNRRGGKLVSVVKKGILSPFTVQGKMLWVITN